MLEKTGDVSENLSWYKCPICSQTLSDRIQLENHLMHVHEWDRKNSHDEGERQYYKINKLKE